MRGPNGGEQRASRGVVHLTPSMWWPGSKLPPPTQIPQPSRGVVLSLCPSEVASLGSPRPLCRAEEGEKWLKLRPESGLDCLIAFQEGQLSFTNKTIFFCSVIFPWFSFPFFYKF